MKKSDEEAFEMWTYTGSLFYRAPESFALGYTEAIDMWATGIVAF
jgi:serine/threonine protein kinase